MKTAISHFQDETPSKILATLHEQCFAKNWSVTDFEKLLRLPGVFSHILTVDDNPVGFALYQEASEEAEILTICILPSYQGHALGELILQAGMASLKETSCERLFLEVAKNNQPACRLYEKAGFRQIGVRRNYYKAGDQKIDALVLEKQLGEI